MGNPYVINARTKTRWKTEVLGNPGVRLGMGWVSGWGWVRGWMGSVTPSRLAPVVKTNFTTRLDNIVSSCLVSYTKQLYSSPVWVKSIDRDIEVKKRKYDWIKEKKSSY